MKCNANQPTTIKACIKPKMENGEVVFIQATSDKGEPLYGKNKDGNLVAVLVPDFYVDVNSLRGLFHYDYPEGRVETIRTTLDPVYDQERKTWIMAPEVIEVRLYGSETAENPISNGFGKSVPTEANKYPELPSAISLAFANAMKNLGYVGEAEIREMQREASVYYELKEGEKPSSIIPVDLGTLFEEEAAAATEAPVAQEIVKEEALATNSVFAAMAQATSAVKDPDPARDENCKDITADNAKEVLFSTTKDNWSKYNGQSFAANIEKDSMFEQIITALARNPQRYAGCVSEDSIKAAAILAA